MNSGSDLPSPAQPLCPPVDLLVVGGGFAGLAAAITAARNGAKVLLTESRTALGAELTATLRPWLAPESLAGLAAQLGDLSGAAVPAGGELALVPDQLKIVLEDLLLDSGAELRYGLRPTGWRGSGPYEVSFAAKPGAFVVQAARVIDATAGAELAGWQARREARPPQAIWRSLELTGVDLGQVGPGPLAVPADLASQAILHLGHAPNGHLLIEHALPASCAAGSASGQELEARTLSLALARWLREHHPAFGQARVTETALELSRGPGLRLRLEGGGPELALTFGRWPEGAFQLGGGFWVAGPGADVADADATALARDPARLAELGASLGRRVLQDAPGGGLSGEWQLPPRQERAVDVLVVGGGTSGVAAAIGAARTGARVLLAEMNMGLGGTGTLGGVDSYWFGRRGGFNAEVSAWTARQHAWMGWPAGAKWNVEGKMLALLERARQEGVQVVLGSVHLAPLVQAGRVQGARLVTPEGLLDVRAHITIDATGDGDVAVAAGAEAVYGSAREGNTMWYSLAPHPRPGLTKNNFTSSVDVGDPADYTRAILSGRRRLVGHDHGPYLAPRESRHVVGEVCLTLTDQLSLRQWPDVVNIHFSNHDVKGHTTSPWLRLGLIPPNLEVEVPYRALLPRGVGGLLITGKALSAEHDALPAIRMQADLENLGFACGTAAGLCARRGCDARDLPLAELQGALVRAGLLPEEVLTRTLAADNHDDSAWREWVEALDDGQPLYQLSFMSFEEVRREPIPFVQVCTAGPGIRPLLREQLGPASPRRLMAARALAWYGDRSAVPVLLEAIGQELRRAGEGLPARVPMPFTQAPPDHGAMPDLAYLLHTLALTRDPRAIPVIETVVQRLEPTDERLRDQLSGLFHYVDAVCDIAERLGDPRCLTALGRLQEHPFFRGHRSRDPIQPDFFAERLAYLEVVIQRAAARCGDRRGAQALIDYLSDVRRPLARHAARELALIAGADHGPSPGGWQRWLDGQERLEPRPWPGQGEGEAARRGSEARRPVSG